ncbi:cyclopropane fatty acid synthase [Gautieria morchelliformis]|nr:cyclopropane fatty acid synthase [Gautieria morchelliformis]
MLNLNVSNHISPSLGSYARSQIISVLSTGIVVGRLEIKDSTGVLEFGDPAESKSTRHSASILVVNHDFWTRIYLAHDLGFAEAYMAADFHTPDLKQIFQVWLDNRKTLSPLSTMFDRVRYIISSLSNRLFGQTLSKSVENVVISYDCSNVFFKAFLSEDMMYSCALWTEEEGGIRGDLENGSLPGQLEAAQTRKIQHLLNKSRVRSGDRLLEVGTGWGALSIAAGKAGCTVDTLTLSVEQKKMADERILAAGLQDRVKVHLMDYRNLPPDFEHAFDGFIACEMFEAVGLKHHAEFFKMMDWALKRDRAAAVITATSQPEFRYSEYQATDYGRRYQWPNTFLPSATSFLETVQRSTQGRFVVDSVEDHGPHYPRTLREWGRRLEASWNSDLIDAVLKDQPTLKEGDNVNIFKRKWQYMYAYAEAGFARAYTSAYCWTLVRPEYVAALCD